MRRLESSITSVRSFEAFPPDFDPSSSSDELLARLGFPPRPETSTAMRERWHQVFSRGLLYVRPQLVERRIDRRLPVGIVRSADGNGTSSNWSGSVVENDRFNDFVSFRWVEGTWTVPSAYPLQTDGSVYNVSHWVGIDGWLSPDLGQAGVHTRVSSSGGNLATHSWAWWEWLPADEVEIVNLPITPGDQVRFLVYVHDSVNGAVPEVTFFAANLSTRVATWIVRNDLSSLNGDTAEWIVERPTTNNVLDQLPDYGQLFFSEGFASGRAAEGATQDAIVDPTSGMLVVMTDDSGQTISIPSVAGPDLLRVRFDPGGSLPATSRFDTVTIAIVTGGDDLRGDSGATATVFAHGFTAALQQVVLKGYGDASWDNASMRSRTIQLNTPVPSNGLKSMTITLLQGGSWPESPDNWNVDGIVVTLEDSTGSNGPVTVLSQTGRPLFRLTGDAPSAELTF